MPYTRWAKKVPAKLMATILSNLNQFQNSFTGRFCSKYAVEWLVRITPHLAYMATLPCKTVTSENKQLTIKYKVV